MTSDSTIKKVFTTCANAIARGKLISRENQQDKEFHFQNWFLARMDETAIHHEQGGRNSYPDFRIVHTAEGYEVKGLAYPGREVTYDCNSQVPSGQHNGRTIFYVFGRYPTKPDGDTYPVLDLVICHGDFLNADHEYVHKNKSLKGFGSYGDIMIRDRKMYVAPTPFGIVSGTAHLQTLILPCQSKATKELKLVGELVRKESDHLIVGYGFDLVRNTLTPQVVPNPNAGREHLFEAWRMRDGSDQPVVMRKQLSSVVEEEEEALDDQ